MVEEEEVEEGAAILCRVGDGKGVMGRHKRGNEKKKNPWGIGFKKALSTFKNSLSAQQSQSTVMPANNKHKCSSCFSSIILVPTQECTIPSEACG